MSEVGDHFTCQEVVELVTEYLDGALSSDEVALFEQHLNFCDGCVWYVDQLRTAIATIGQLPEEELPAESRARLLTAFRDWRQE